MEANRDKKHHQYINYIHCQMLSLLQCPGDVVTSVDLKYGRNQNKSQTTMKMKVRRE